MSASTEKSSPFVGFEPTQREPSSVRPRPASAPARLGRRRKPPAASPPGRPMPATRRSHRRASHSRLLGSTVAASTHAARPHMGQRAGRRLTTAPYPQASQRISMRRLPACCQVGRNTTCDRFSARSSGTPTSNPPCALTARAPSVSFACFQGRTGPAVAPWSNRTIPGQCLQLSEAGSRP